MFLTCLKIGDIITPPKELIESLSHLRRERSNFYYGLLCQYAHDISLMEAGIEFETNPDEKGWWDRMIAGIKHDDKAALRGYNGINTCATTHTIGVTEYKPWCDEIKEGRELVIHSFSQMNNIGSYDFRYEGALAFSRIEAAASRFDSTRCFNRNYAYKTARLV